MGTKIVLLSLNDVQMIFISYIVRVCRVSPIIALVRRYSNAKSWNTHESCIVEGI